MSDAKHTPGPISIVEDQKWPFKIRLVDEHNGWEILSVDRIAHSTGQGTLADCLDAKGFKGQERAKVIAMLQGQMANLRLFAAAPELISALIDLLPHAIKAIEQLNDQMVGSLYPAINDAKIHRAHAAIAKATGK